MPLSEGLFAFAEGREGYYGDYGGAFVPETLHSAVEGLRLGFAAARNDAAFWDEYVAVLREFSGRPTPVTHLHNISERLGGAQIWVKREDLNQTGAHKINNVVGQGLLCRRLGKSRVIAETGAGQHGYATATMAARLGLRCTVYMGAVDVARQRPNVFWMERLGAEVVAVEDGQRTLKDAINEAMRDWVTHPDDTHYVLGTACGPHPFPQLVCWLQSIIGREARGQMLEAIGGLPQRVYACVGGGSNAMGLFQGFLDDAAVELVACEAGGRGPGSGAHAVRLAWGEAAVGVAQGYKTRFLQDADGNMRRTHSVAAGLDYIGVAPMLARLCEIGRVRATASTDEEVLAALRRCMKDEGLIPALESCHALARGFAEAAQMPPDQHILINLSGRGDKDIFTIAEALDDNRWRDFIAARAARYAGG